MGVGIVGFGLGWILRIGLIGGGIVKVGCL